MCIEDNFGNHYMALSDVRYGLLIFLSKYYTMLVSQAMAIPNSMIFSIIKQRTGHLQKNSTSFYTLHNHGLVCLTHSRWLTTIQDIKTSSKLSYRSTGNYSHQISKDVHNTNESKKVVDIWINHLSIVLEGTFYVSKYTQFERSCDEQLYGEISKANNILHLIATLSLLRHA